MKFIFVSGGVVSGLGKGAISASLSFLLKSRGYKVTNVKADMYFNIDAGTLRPQEHGEVFVTHDGVETDEDLGHYERFLHESLRRENYITAGQIYQEVLRKERSFEYSGETIDVIPHVTDEIIRRIRLAGEVNKSDIVIVEYGGTVGEFKNQIFFEAARILKFEHPRDVIHIHVTYLPYMRHIGELKSKPAQTSVHVLNSLGIQPEILVARSEVELDDKRMEKLALYCNIPKDQLFSAPDLDTIYRIPLLLHQEKHHFATTCLRLLSLPPKHHTNLQKWSEVVNRVSKKWPKSINIAVVGKYFATGEFQLADSYVSVIEAVKHASASLGVNSNLSWIDSEKFEHNEADLSGYDGIIVPQGWGSRGTEGKLAAVKFAREHKIPYLGLCFGMQMASIEFARNVLGMKDANSTEVNPETKHPVIHIMPEQKEYLAKNQYGGTIRLGAWPCVVKPGTKLSAAYEKYGAGKDKPWNQPRLDRPSPDTVSTKTNTLIFERHRHRYEFNNDFRPEYEKEGFVISGTSPDGKLVEAVELSDHPFFVGTQFHPEYISRPLTPHPIFLAFIEAATGK